MIIQYLVKPLLTSGGSKTRLETTPLAIEKIELYKSKILMLKLMDFWDISAEGVDQLIEYIFSHISFTADNFLDSLR